MDEVFVSEKVIVLLVDWLILQFQQHLVSAQRQGIRSNQYRGSG
jgi:hypothetical protein